MTFQAWESEPFQIGDTVRARFTNSGYLREFTGRIVGEAKNFWKVESITSPYADQGEQPGRVFHIFKPRAKQYSANNRIAEKISEQS
jgi:hypothetical protein